MALKNKITENTSNEFTFDELYDAFNELLIDFKGFLSKIRNLES